MLALFMFVTHIYPDSIPQCNINLPGRQTPTTPHIGTLIDHRAPSPAASFSKS